MAESRTEADPSQCWVLVDERAGTAAQSLGVAEALGLPFEVKNLHYVKAAGLPNLVLGASLAGIDRASQEGLSPPWPGLVISAGRRSAPIARWIKRRADRPVFLAHIMFPGRGGIEDFDLVAVPRHDEHVARPNQFAMTGAPHRLSVDSLTAAQAEWQQKFAHFPRPLIGLLVGGATRRQPFTDATANKLAQLTIEAVKSTGGSLMVSTSRRTGAAAETLSRSLSDAGVTPAVFHRWGDEGDNPYQGILGLADGIIATGDSVSMCAEACATTGPVYIFAPDGFVTAKHRRFHEELYALGLARPFKGAFETWTHDCLNSADDVANEIRRLMAL
jgi:mitochondrial fission protein ELM1